MVSAIGILARKRQWPVAQPGITILHIAIIRRDTLRCETQHVLLGESLVWNGKPVRAIVKRVHARAQLRKGVAYRPPTYWNHLNDDGTRRTNPAQGVNGATVDKRRGRRVNGQPLTTRKPPSLEPISDIPSRQW